MAFVAAIVATFVIIQVFILVKTLKKIFPDIKERRWYKFSKVILHTGPVILIIIFSIVIYFTKIIELNFNLKNRSTRLSVIIHAVFTVYIWINVTFNYFAALVIKPGRPPRRTELLDESTSAAQNLSEVNLDFCSHCDRLQTYGTHHCRKCGDCIRMMCHHSSIVNNCIGISNFSYYFCFMVYSCVGLTYLFYMTFSPFYACYLHDHDKSSISIIYPVLSLKACKNAGELPLMFIVVLVAAVAIGVLLMLHCFLLAADFSLVLFIKHIQESESIMSTMKNVFRKSFKKQRRIKFNVLLRTSKKSWKHFLFPSLNIIVDDLSFDDIFDEHKCYVQMV